MAFLYGIRRYWITMIFEGRKDHYAPIIMFTKELTTYQCQFIPAFIPAYYYAVHSGPRIPVLGRKCIQKDAWRNPREQPQKNPKPQRGVWGDQKAQEDTGTAGVATGMATDASAATSPSVSRGVPRIGSTGEGRSNAPASPTASIADALVIP